MALMMSLVGDTVILVLYGEYYSDSVKVLVLHIWASVFVFLGVVSSMWYLSENYQVLAFMRTFYGMLCNLFLNYLFIPIYGTQGAAMATLISYLVAGLLFDVLYKKTRFIFMMKVKALLFRV